MRRPQRLTLLTDGPYDEAVNKRPRKPAPRRASGESLVRSLLEAAGVVEARLEAAVGPLSLAKLGVLRPLVEAKQPLPLSELAERQHCVRSNITQLVDRLEKEGLVRRRADPTDRRSVLAALTPAGSGPTRRRCGRSPRSSGPSCSRSARETRPISRASWSCWQTEERRRPQLSLSLV